MDWRVQLQFRQLLHQTGVHGSGWIMILYGPANEGLGAFIGIRHSIIVT